jgi:hypothetical protein
MKEIPEEARARQWAAELRANAEAYHAGTIEYAGYTTENLRIWDAARAAGLQQTVSLFLGQPMPRRLGGRRVSR